jgi:hypothetical protein
MLGDDNDNDNDEYCDINNHRRATDGDSGDIDKEVVMLCPSPAEVPVRRYMSHGPIIDVIDENR